jgi:hypothetical protein
MIGVAQVIGRDTADTRTHSRVPGFTPVSVGSPEFVAVLVRIVQGPDGDEDVSVNQYPFGGVPLGHANVTVQPPVGRSHSQVGCIDRDAAAFAIVSDIGLTATGRSPLHATKK